MSGAGKRTALAALAAAGVDAVDNLPVELLPGFSTLNGTPRVAVVDTRQGEAVAELTIPEGARVVFLDCRDEVLARRLADSTAPHPRAAAGNIPARIADERRALEALRGAADIVVDTSDIDAAALGARLVDLVATPRETTFRCTVSSFGFKYGAEREADWVFDVRFLPNPFWVEELRPMNGRDEPVRRYVLDAPETVEFLKRAGDLLTWTVERCIEHRRTALHIAVGCTGGRHRSVAVSTALADILRAAGHETDVHHRDVERPDPR